jgi:hypothetical protein
MQTARRLQIVFLLALLALMTSVAAPRNAQAQSGKLCFPETNQCIVGSIGAYWKQHGGLPIFGYPITPERIETVEGQTVPVQWFERDRLEDHGAVGVLAGRLGASVLEQTNRPWQYFKSVDPASTPTDCQFFAPTGHSLCEPYLSYWRHQGGLERFGYPITQPIYDNVEDNVEQHKLAIQYFERRRMEIHPELPGSPILLGLLGGEVLAQPTPITRYPDCLAEALPSLRYVNIGKPLGCPQFSALPGVRASTQQFERGIMIWIDSSNLPGRFKPGVPDIFALITPGPQLQIYDDTWTADTDPNTPLVTPPSSDYYAPWRGFGKVWMANPALRDAIGWATESEAQARTADIQLFETGLLVRIQDTGVVYAFGNTNTPTAAQIVTP